MGPWAQGLWAQGPWAQGPLAQGPQVQESAKNTKVVQNIQKDAKVTQEVIILKK